MYSFWSHCEYILSTACISLTQFDELLVSLFDYNANMFFILQQEWIIIHYAIIYFTSLLLNITKVAQYIRIDHTTNINTAFSDVCVPFPTITVRLARILNGFNIGKNSIEYVIC